MQVQGERKAMAEPGCDAGATDTSQASPQGLPRCAGLGQLNSSRQNAKRNTLGPTVSLDTG